MNHKALAVVLSEKLADKEIIIVDSLEIKESKTKKMGKALESLKIKGSVLFGFLKSEQEAKRASRNIPRVDNIDAENLNIFDILNHKYLVLSEEGVKMIEKKYKK